MGDNVVYPYHGAGKVLKKEEMEVLGDVASTSQDPAQRHDGKVRTENARIAACAG